MSEAKQINDGGPAFPCAGCLVNQPGMTLRQWYAGMAMQGILANQHTVARGATEADITRLVDLCANVSFRIADAMIERGQRE